MALPQAIQAQVEAADAALAAMNQPVEAPEIPVAPLTPDQPQAREAEPPPQAAPAPAQPQPDPWEHKYKTLQGRYNSDVPALQTQVKELKNQLEDAVTKLNEVAKPVEKQEKRPVADPQDVEAFGSDLVGMVQRVAERMFGSAASEFKAQAASIEQRLARVEESLKGTSQTVAVNAEQAFFDRLAKLVPNWEEINANQAFLDWLAEVDPVYGQPKQSALDAAQRSLNAERAANVFKAFAATLPQQPKSNPVDKQVSPKAAASSAPTGTDNKPIYTQKQISDFYNVVARGAYRGRQQEMQQIEAKINAALAEGRIR
jgi:uncharacterized protein YukE